MLAAEWEDEIEMRRSRRTKGRIKLERGLSIK
jgi:hypothetical protein